MIAIAVLLLIFLTIFIIRKKAGKIQKTDYYNLFIMGVIWLPFGILMSMRYGDSSIGNIFIILGIIYTGIGLAHRKEWKKNHRTWKQLTEKERKWKIWAITILTITLIAGITTFYLINGNMPN
jgi:hypothetical protein